MHSRGSIRCARASLISSVREERYRATPPTCASSRSGGSPASMSCRKVPSRCRSFWCTTILSSSVLRSMWTRRVLLMGDAVGLCMSTARTRSFCRRKVGMRIAARSSSGSGHIGALHGSATCASCSTSARARRTKWVCSMTAAMARSWASWIAVRSAIGRRRLRSSCAPFAGTTSRSRGIRTGTGAARSPVPSTARSFSISAAHLRLEPCHRRSTWAARTAVAIPRMPTSTSWSCTGARSTPSSCRVATSNVRVGCTAWISTHTARSPTRRSASDDTRASSPFLRLVFTHRCLRAPRSSCG